MKSGNLLRTTAKSIAIIVIFIFCVVAALSDWAAYRQAKLADSLLDELRKKSISAITSDDVFSLQRRFGGRPRGSCSPAACSIEFRFDNSTLHRVHLAPLTVVGVIIELGGMHVSSERAEMVVFTRPQPAANTAVVPLGHYGSTLPYTIHINRGTRDRPLYMSFELSPNSPTAARELGFTYRVSCLYRLGGCNSVKELVPGWPGR